MRGNMRVSRLEIGLMAAMALATSLYVVLFHFPAPYFDEWDLAPMLEAADAGTLNLGDLFAIHGGHWHASAYAIFLPLARLTHWSQTAEAIASLLFLSGACALLLRMGASFALHSPGARFGAIGIASVFFCFSPDQSSNLLWTFQLSVFVSLFGAALCLAALAQERFTAMHFAVALTGMAIGITSYATSFALFPAGLLLIAARTEASWLHRALYALIWVTIGSVAMAAFLEAQRHSPFGADATAGVLSRPDLLAFLVGFEINYLGAAIARTSTILIPPLALAGPVMALAAAWFLVRRGVALRVLAAPLALCVFGIGAGLLCAAGRIYLGPGQGGSGRYVSFSGWFWLGAAWLLLAALAQIKSTLLRRATITLIVLCALLKLVSGVQAANKSIRVTREVSAVVAAMQADPAHAAEAARAIAWERQDIARHVAFIQRKRWSVFGDAQPASRS